MIREAESCRIVYYRLEGGWTPRRSVRDPTNLFPPPRSRTYPIAVFGKVFFPIEEIFREGESGTFLHLGVFIDRVRASTNDLSVVISWGWPRKWRADEM